MGNDTPNTPRPRRTLIYAGVKYQLGVLVVVGIAGTCVALFVDLFAPSNVSWAIGAGLAAVAAAACTLRNAVLLYRLYRVPTTPDGFYRRGVAFQELVSDVDRANADFSQALKLDPEHQLSLIARGKNYAEHDRALAYDDLKCASSAELSKREHSAYEKNKGASISNPLCKAWEHLMHHCVVQKDSTTEAECLRWLLELTIPDYETRRQSLQFYVRMIDRAIELRQRELVERALLIFQERMLPVMEMAVGKALSKEAEAQLPKSSSLIGGLVSGSRIAAASASQRAESAHLEALKVAEKAAGFLGSVPQPAKTPPLCESEEAPTRDPEAPKMPIEEASAEQPIPLETADRVAVLMEDLQSGKKRVRLKAITELANLGPQAIAALDALDRAVDDPKRAVGLAALGALRSIGKPAVNALIRALGSEDAKIRTDAANALRQIGPDPECAVRPLIAAMTRSGQFSSKFRASPTPDEEARKAAAETLGSFGTAAGEAVPAMIQLLKGEASFGSLFTLGKALAMIGRSAVPDLIEAYSDKGASDFHQSLPKNFYHSTIVIALGRIGPDAESAVPLLTEALSRQDAGVRMNAAEALGRIGPSARTAVPALLACLRDTNRDTNVNVPINAIGAVRRIALPTGQVMSALEEVRDRFGYSCALKVSKAMVVLLQRKAEYTEEQLAEIENVQERRELESRANEDTATVGPASRIAHKWGTIIQDDKVFFAPDIPEKKLANALQHYALGARNETVLVLVDDTIFGSAKQGAVITNNRLYVRNDFGPINETELIEIKSTEYRWGMPPKLLINGKALLRCTGPKRRSVKQLADMLVEIAGAIRADLAEPAATAAPRDLDEDTLEEDKANESAETQGNGLADTPNVPQATTTAADQQAAGSTDGAEPGKQWYYSRDGKTKHGPVPTTTLKDLISSGALRRDSLVSRDGKKWYLAAKLKGAKWPAGSELE